MSRLLVVVPAADGGLEGVLADVCELRDGARVFLRAGVEVLRADEHLPLVVRSVPRPRRAGRDVVTYQEESRIRALM